MGLAAVLQAKWLYKRDLWGLLLLVIAGFLGNYFRWTLFFDIDFLFGSIAVWLVVCLYGVRWGTLAGYIAGSCTYIIWHHPYTTLTFTLEALFVGWLFQRRPQQNIVLLDALFWLFIGMPLVWLFYAIVMDMGSTQAFIIMLKQPVNGVFNALIASLLLTYLPIHRWVSRPPAISTLSLRQTLFNLLVAFVMVPTLILIILASHQVVDDIKMAARTDLNNATRYLTVEVHAWYERRLTVLNELATLAMQPSVPDERVRQNGKFAQRILPEFQQIHILDQTGKRILDIEDGAAQGQESFDDTPYFAALQRSPRAFVSLVRPKPDSATSPTAIMGVPIRRDGRFVGAVLSELDLGGITKLLQANVGDQELNITLVDQQNTVAASTHPEWVGQPSFDWREQGKTEAIGEQTYHWLPITVSPLVLLQWSNSLFVKETTISSEFPLRLIVQMAATSHVKHIEVVHTHNMLILLVVSGFAPLAAMLVSRQLVKPIAQLATVTTNLPEKLLAQAPIHWSQSQVTEFALLIDNFRSMAVSLQQKFGEIQQANALLEERVQERTEALQESNVALCESEERFRQMAENIHEVFWMKEVNHQQMLYVSPAYEEIWGRTCASLYETPLSFLDVIHPNDRDRVIAAVAKQRQEDYDEEYRIIQPNGSIRWIWDRAFPIQNEAGEIYRLVGVAQDITERKQAEEALRKSEEQFRLIFERAPIGIALNSMDGRFLSVNPALCEALGYSSNELLSQTFADVSHIDDLAADLNLNNKLQEGAIAHFQVEKRYLAKDGRVVNGILHATLVHDATGKPLHMLSQVFDITDRKRMEEQLIHDAFHDALTGLHNRVLFVERLQQAIVRANRNPEEQCAVLFLDLDRFKLVNDSLGHLVGDQLLIAIAQRLQLCLRPGDTVARLGGDEFSILLEPIQSISDATSVAENIQQALSVSLLLNGYEIFTTASIGIAFSITGYESPEDLLRDADTAMYRAKEQGKACYALFDTNMYDQMITRLQLETDLRWAIERQELCVYYQAIVSLETEQLIGFEALVRWQHPARGLISPSEFIPVAEETGLIVSLGEWVLQTSCQQLCQWQDQFPALPLTISVNLSSKQLSQPNLVQQVDQILRQTGLAPERLKLELTESSIMQNSISAAKLLAQLKARKIQLSIDDFGTGYSSLSRLHEFPIDTLKIDRSFVNLINQMGENTKMVEAIIALAHSLGMDVVAEGVETAEQLTKLKQLNCEYGQGYLFSKPLNQQAAGALIAKVSSQKVIGLMDY